MGECSGISAFWALGLIALNLGLGVVALILRGENERLRVRVWVLQEECDLWRGRDTENAP